MLFRSADWRHSVPARTRAFASLDAETRSFVIQTLRALVPLGVRVVPGLLAEDAHRARSAAPAVAEGPRREPSEGRGEATAPTVADPSTGARG